MADTFEEALQFTLESEGGFVDNPDDSGGATNHGITQAVYNQWLIAHGAANQSVANITDTQVELIYNGWYWVPAKCALMTPALAVAHFDWAVNHGVAGAIHTLQNALGISSDGIFGPHTESALKALDTGSLWVQYNELRLEWYQGRINEDPSQSIFWRGWYDRVQKLNALCKTLETENDT